MSLFEFWYNESIELLKGMANNLARLKALRDKLSRQSMDFRAAHPKFAYWYDEDVPSKAVFNNRKECQKYLKYLAKQKEILVDLRTVSTRYYYYHETVLTMKSMLIDAINTHCDRQGKHILKEFNGGELCQKTYSLTCKKYCMIRQVYDATNGVENDQ